MGSLSSDSAGEDCRKSFSHSCSRNEDEETARTIDSLRRRLLAERAASKSAKDAADHNARRLMELENQLRIEQELRTKAEAAMEEALAKLKLAGIPTEEIASVFSDSDNISQQYSSCHSQENNASSKEDEIEDQTGTAEMNIGDNARSQITEATHIVEAGENEPKNEDLSSDLSVGQNDLSMQVVCAGNGENVQGCDSSSDSSIICTFNGELRAIFEDKLTELCNRGAAPADVEHWKEILRMKLHEWVGQVLDQEIDHCSKECKNVASGNFPEGPRLPDNCVCISCSSDKKSSEMQDRKACQLPQLMQGRFACADYNGCNHVVQSSMKCFADTPERWKRSPHCNSGTKFFVNPWIPGGEMDFNCCNQNSNELLVWPENPMQLMNCSNRSLMQTPDCLFPGMPNCDGYSENTKHSWNKECWRSSEYLPGTKIGYTQYPKLKSRDENILIALGNAKRQIQTSLRLVRESGRAQGPIYFGKSSSLE